MSSSASSALGADEKYEIAVSYGCIIGTGLLAILVCSTRLWVRKFMTKSFGLDDWACLFGLIVVTVFNGIGLAVVYYGSGKHIQHVSQEDLSVWFLLYYICISLYLFVSLAVKSSILLLLKRVFPTPYIQRTTLFMLIFLVLFSVSGTAVAVLQCNPPKYAFDLAYVMSPDRAGHCFSQSVAYWIFMYQAIVLFICDVVIFLLPFPALVKLHMDPAKKTALLFVFGSGLIACIAPAIRFKSLDFYKDGAADTTYLGASSLYWMAIEYNIGLVAGSLTGLRPLLSRVGVLMSSRRNGLSYKSRLTPSSPSYRLDTGDNKHWVSSSERSGAKKNRVQGDSILELTVMADRSSEELALKTQGQQILRTQSITITHETRGSTSIVNTHVTHPWQEIDEKHMV